MCMCMFHSCINEVRDGHVSLLVSYKNISSGAYLVRSGLKDSFHWYTQSSIFIRSLVSAEAKAFL